MCWSAQIHYSYIETPLFIAQNAFDQNQIGDILGVDWWPFKNSTKGTLFRVGRYLACHDSNEIFLLVEQFKVLFGEFMVNGTSQVRY